MNYKDINNAISKLKASPIGGIFADGCSLYDISKFTVVEDGCLSDVLPVGTGFWDIFESSDVNDMLSDLSELMFPDEYGIKNMSYTPYIALSVLSKAILPSVSNGSTVFNPEGSVSIADFLFGVASVFGITECTKDSVDCISHKDDYFNAGYNSCLMGYSSPFFNLYKRDELFQPILRCELSYITVLCFSKFIERFGNVYGNKFYLGITFDWEHPKEILSKYSDGFDYKVSKVPSDLEYSESISTSIKEYKNGVLISDYKSFLKSGVSSIPLPMFMSLIELGEIGIFCLEDSNIEPLREVSRGELCYFLANLARLI